MITSDDICIVMNVNFDNYAEQFKEWFEWYKDKYRFKVYLATNRLNLFDDFVDEKLYLFDTEDLLKKCPETFDYEKIICEKVLPYNSYPWSVHRHIKRMAFDDGFKVVISIESDTRIKVSEELLLKKLNNFDTNKIYTSAAVYCKKNAPQWERWSKCTAQLNKDLNLNIEIDKYCTPDGTNIIFYFDKNKYKSFFNDWDKFALHKFSTGNLYPNAPQSTILQCCANNDIPVESTICKYFYSKHNMGIRYHKTDGLVR